MPWYRYERHFVKSSGKISPDPIVSIFESENNYVALIHTAVEDVSWESFMKARVKQGSRVLVRGFMRRGRKVFQRKNDVDIRAEIRQHKKDVKVGKFGS